MGENERENYPPRQQILKKHDSDPDFKASLSAWAGTARVWARPRWVYYRYKNIQRRLITATFHVFYAVIICNLNDCLDVLVRMRAGDSGSLTPLSLRRATFGKPVLIKTVKNDIKSDMI